MIVENARPTTLQERLDPTFAAVLIQGFAIGDSNLSPMVDEFPFFRFSIMSCHAIEEAAIADKHMICLNRSGRIVMFWLGFFCKIFDTDTADKAIMPAKVD